MRPGPPPAGTPGPPVGRPVPSGAGTPGPPPVGRPGPPAARPGPPPAARPGPPPAVGHDDEVDDARHPAVDAAVRAMANAEGLSPADQIAQYEAAYQTLRETLATIDQT
ncbi:hypothetical protein ACN268_00990 [Micromonospora sp. WMMD735]|uniref:hypothetical protein n=1 Tax=Micromonospora sp. WMMD735 TaxID=3404130 RepID=UPI003B92F984